MAMSGRHLSAGHHRGDDGGVGGERAAGGGAGSTGAGPRTVRQRPRESALPPSQARHARRLRSLEANQVAWAS